MNICKIFRKDKPRICTSMAELYFLTRAKEPDLSGGNFLPSQRTPLHLWFLHPMYSYPRHYKLPFQQGIKAGVVGQNVRLQQGRTLGKTSSDLWLFCTLKTNHRPNVCWSDERTRIVLTDHGNLPVCFMVFSFFCCCRSGKGSSDIAVRHSVLGLHRANPLS